MTHWRKSSYSNLNGNCVEVGAMAKSPHSESANCVEAGPCTCGGDILVRDSKDRDGGTLAFSPQAWEAFTAGIRAGEFSRG